MAPEELGGGTSQVALKEDPPNARGGVLCDADGVVHGMYVMASWVEERETPSEASHTHSLMRSFGAPYVQQQLHSFNCS
eukprot:1602196-Amphidinium_carterae.1